MLKIAH